ncbi:MAG: choice-of-anchor Q domain-containing protein [Phycisphaerales bacterium]
MRTHPTRRLLASSAFLVALAGSAFGATLTVPGDFPTIEAAIAAAQEGDEIVVAPGTYSRVGGPIWSSVESGGRNITVRSSDGPEVTILDGGGTRIVELFLGETTATRLEGFTLTNGDSPTNYGGAAFFFGGSATVVNCVFEGNNARYGGAVSNYENEGTVYIGCVFRNNTAEFGGATWNFESASAFIDCLFEENSVASNFSNEGGATSERVASTLYERCVFRGNTNEELGGAMWARFESDVTLIDCVIEGNTAGGSGGGLYATTDSRVTAINTRFLGNTAGQFGGGMHSTFSESVTLINCEFSGNRAGTAFNRRGGGAYLQDLASVRIVNSSFVGNYGSSASGQGMVVANVADVVVANSIFWANLGAFGFEGFEPTRDENDQLTFSGAGTLDVRNLIVDQYSATPGVAMSGDDPMLVDSLGADGIVGTSDDDNRLGMGSPAIDAGDDAALPMDEFDLDSDSDVTEAIPFDLDGAARVAGGAVDLGAYEVQSGAEPCVGDTNGDNVVNFADLNAVLSGFGQTGAGLPGDVTGDDAVNFADLNTVLSEFGNECM